MALLTWPATLPDVPLRDFSSGLNYNVLVTSMENNSAKMRNRGRKPQPLAISMVMTAAQITTLDAFIASLNATEAFEFLHPRTGATVVVRFLPSGDGQIYGLAYTGPPDLYAVSFTLEVAL